MPLPPLTQQPASVAEHALQHVKTPPPCSLSQPKSVSTPCSHKANQSAIAAPSKWSAKWTQKASVTAATPSRAKQPAPKRSPHTGSNASTAHTCAHRSSLARNKPPRPTAYIRKPSKRSAFLVFKTATYRSHQAACAQVL